MKRQKRIFLCCGLLLAASELWKQWCLTYLLNNGSYNWWYFPFQLCSIPMYVCLILPWLKSGRLYRILRAFLADFGLLGGIFAFFDTSGMHYGYAPLTIHSFTWHIALILIGLYAIYCQRQERQACGYAAPAACYLLCCQAATGMNLAFYQYGSINMFYISPHYEMTQKIFCQIAETLGNPWGIASYIGANLVGGYVIHQLGTEDF